MELGPILELVASALASTNRLLPCIRYLLSRTDLWKLCWHFLLVEPAIVENNITTSFIEQFTPTVCPLIVLAEQRGVMWRSTGRRFGWEISSSCDVMRSSLLMFCCWAPVTRTVCATSRRPHWMERPTSSRGRSSAASLNWSVLLMSVFAFSQLCLHLC